MNVRKHMKRLCALLLIMGMLLSLPACGTGRRVKSVMGKIDTLTEITLESGPVLDEIEAAYYALSEREKQQVSNLEILSGARKRYDEMKAEDERKQKNEAVIEALRLLETLRSSDSSDLNTAIETVQLILMLRMAGLLV